MRPIPRMITQITGITQEMVAGAPRIEEVIPELLEFLEGAVVVAHNASFDVGFLNYELRRLKGRRLGEGAIDTLPLARALAPGLPNYRLQTVAEALGAPVAACHRALADAQAAGHVFVTLVGRLQEQGITRLSEIRSYVNPSSRSSLEKLHLTRDLPGAQGRISFVDKDGRILYVGKADRLRERVRSHFVANADHARKVRQAVRMVERIDWDETCTPLEAVVREQELILEHRPPCNLHGGRPETYAYLKVGGSGPGLNLFVSSRAPKWRGSDRPAAASPVSRWSSDLFADAPPDARAGSAVSVATPFAAARGSPTAPLRARYPRRSCLAPCSGDPETHPGARRPRDATSSGWLAGQADVDLPDPFERADEVVANLSPAETLSRRPRRMREASEHLLSVRRSYASLAEARSLRFATLWPQDNERGRPVSAAELGVGRPTVRTGIARSGYGGGRNRRSARALSGTRRRRPPWVAPPPWQCHRRISMSLLAIRRWFYETDYAPQVVDPRSGGRLGRASGVQDSTPRRSARLFLTKTPRREGRRSYLDRCHLGLRKLNTLGLHHRRKKTAIDLPLVDGDAFPDTELDDVSSLRPQLLRQFFGGEVVGHEISFPG